MAGDWLPMRLDVGEDPAVIAIAAAVGIEEDAVVGKLHRLWSWANRHLITGDAPGVTESWVDRYVAAPGFAAAMLSAGWLRSRSGHVEFPNFDRWNSEGAKNRLTKTAKKRAERSRQNGDNVAETKATIPRPLRTFVLNRDGNRCVNCGWKPGDGGPPMGLPGGDRLSIDHATPESKGGKTVAENLVALCMKCNQEKGGRTFEEAGMSPDLSHISGDKSATETRPKESREEYLKPPPEAGGGEKPKRKRKPKPDAPPKQRDRDPLFDAVAEVTVSDPALVGSNIARVRHRLAQADPPYTSDEVREFGRRFQEICTWAKGDNRPPALEELLKNISKLRGGAEPDWVAERKARTEREYAEEQARGTP